MVHRVNHAPAQPAQHLEEGHLQLQVVRSTGTHLTCISRCGKMTLKCKGCAEAHARGRTEYSDDYCRACGWCVS